MSELMKLKANLRVCASCEWIFRNDVVGCNCPKCDFGSYGAHHVYGNRCYRFAKTQEPWYDQKMFDYSCKLQKEISDDRCERSERTLFTGCSKIR